MPSSNYTVLLGGANVNVEAGSLDLTNEIGQRSQGSMTVWTGAGVVYNYGTSVTVKDGSGATVYTGFVVEDQITKPGFAALLEHQLTVVDNHYLADKRLAFASFLNQSAGAIVTSLWTSYLKPEGVTLGAVASGIIVPEFVSNYEPVSQGLDKLATMCGYWWQIDQNRALAFQPYGALSAPFTLDGTQMDQTKNLSVTVGNKDYRNRQYGVGGKDHTAVLTETFAGDGVRRAFTLRYPVGGLTGRDKKSGLTRGIYVNNVAQKIDNKSIGSGSQWYYAVSDATVAQDTSLAPLTSGDTLKVIYDGEYPVVALAQDTSLIASQRTLEGIGTGYVESRYSNLKIHTLGAMFTAAQAQLQHYGSTMTTLTFATQTAGLVQGQTLTVNLPDFALTNRAMLIESVEITDSIDSFNVWYVVTCVGSPYSVAQWQTFWTNLLNQDNAADTEADNQSDGSALAQINQSTGAWNMSGVGRHSKAVCPIISNTTFIGNNVIIC